MTSDWRNEDASKNNGHMVWGLVRQEIKRENETFRDTMVYQEMREEVGFYKALLNYRAVIQI